jgi:hypothetical protein
MMLIVSVEFLRLRLGGGKPGSLLALICASSLLSGIEGVTLATRNWIIAISRSNAIRRSRSNVHVLFSPSLSTTLSELLIICSADATCISMELFFFPWLGSSWFHFPPNST